MHTIDIPCKKVTDDKGKVKEAWVHHNGDWSGNAIICWVDSEGKDHEVTVPGMILAYSSASFVLDKVVSTVESLDPNKLIQK